MASPDLTVPSWPVAEATVNPDGTATLTLNGQDRAINAATPAAARAELVQLVRDELALDLGRPVRLRTTDPDGSQGLLAVAPDGSVTDLAPTRQPAAAPPGPIGHAIAAAAFMAAGLPTKEGIARGPRGRRPERGRHASRALAVTALTLALCIVAVAGTVLNRAPQAAAPMAAATATATAHRLNQRAPAAAAASAAWDARSAVARQGEQDRTVAAAPRARAATTAARARRTARQRHAVQRRAAQHRAARRRAATRERRAGRRRAASRPAPVQPRTSPPVASPAPVAPPRAAAPTPRATAVPCGGLDLC